MCRAALKQTRQPFWGLAVVVGTPGQVVGLTRLGTFPSVPMQDIETWLNCVSPPAQYLYGPLVRPIQSTALL
jgi:hypothetical protein